VIIIKYQNPIIRGFNPDPSICRVGSDFYLVTSTFEYFPGVPLYQSKNLINWELIGHCLSDKEQLDLGDCRDSGGIYAPTLRFRNGRFYMVTTNVSGGGNFIIYTDDIKGKWSRPHYVDQGGIDPSLLFDGDHTYFTSTGTSEGEQCILCCEIDPESGKRLTESKPISFGWGGRCCEGPHLYHIGEFYYLMTAEGGTEYGHMETIRRSESPWGPFEECPHNPILSHRDYNKSGIQATGHADLTDDENGNWWMVNLAVRVLPTHVMLHNLGRETFLAPVLWKEGWPEVGDNGHESPEMDAVLPGEPEKITHTFTDDFIDRKPKEEWSFVRNPVPENYIFGGGKLILCGTDNSLNSLHPTFIGIRQKEFNATERAELSTRINKGGKAGVTAYYNHDYHAELFIERRNGVLFAVLNLAVHGIHVKLGESEIPETEQLALIIETGADNYLFSVDSEGQCFKIGEVPTACFCTECTHTMTFTGTWLGIFSEKTNAEFFNIKIDWKSDD
jgi:xylan 1,4-beta-xylosidase